MTFTMGSRTIGGDEPTYFIADIAANHDGELDRAVELVRLAAEAGADAAKFQNFSAAGIVSDYGFKALGGQQSHQASWEKSVFEVYADASIPGDWTPVLKQACDDAGIDYFSAPYDLAAIDMLEPYVPAYKVGSGDVDWLDSIRAMARKGKPMLVATGAATLADVVAAVEAVLEINPDLCLMQCNTNYTADPGNMRYLNLRVLESYRQLFPDVVLGLSDHTAGHVSVLGAIALGARVVEKHFTDDTGEARPGPQVLDGPGHLAGDGRQRPGPRVGARQPAQEGRGQRGGDRRPAAALPARRARPAGGHRADRGGRRGPPPGHPRRAAARRLRRGGRPDGAPRPGVRPGADLVGAGLTARWPG